jgi:hypothetical protein
MFVLDPAFGVLLEPPERKELSQMYRLPHSAAALALLCAAAGANAACLDLSQSEPRRLTGVLLQRGRSDSHELGYILKLSEPICLTGGQNVDPGKPISEVQVFATEKTREAFRALQNSKVTIELSQPAEAKPGDQPFIARVTNILPAAIAAPDDAAAAAVTGFYRALGRGNGDEAAGFIVPESRSGPLSADAMSRFYGDLALPLELLSVQPDGSGAYAVRYRFRSSGGQCNGRAIVKTAVRDGVNLISSIRALDGC